MLRILFGCVLWRDPLGWLPKPTINPTLRFGPSHVGQRRLPTIRRTTTGRCACHAIPLASLQPSAPCCLWSSTASPHTFSAFQPLPTLPPSSWGPLCLCVQAHVYIVLGYRLWECTPMWWVAVQAQPIPTHMVQYCRYTSCKQRCTSSTVHRLGTAMCKHLP